MSVDVLVFVVVEVDPESLDPVLPLSASDPPVVLFPAALPLSPPLVDVLVALVPAAF